MNMTHRLHRPQQNFADLDSALGWLSNFDLATRSKVEDTRVKILMLQDKHGPITRIRGNVEFFEGTCADPQNGIEEVPPMWLAWLMFEFGNNWHFPVRFKLNGQPEPAGVHSA